MALRKLRPSLAKKISEVESCLLSTSVDENLLPDVHNLIVENIDI